MKKVMLLTLVMMFAASLAYGQGGLLAVTADPAGTNCALADFPGLLTYWVVHLYTAGSTASQFSAPMPGCLIGGIWLSDTAQFPVTIGSSQTGVAVGYGVCLASPIATLAINYFGNGLTGNCCPYPVLPDPNVPSGEIEVVDCLNSLVFAAGATTMINPDPTCPCDQAIPTEETTWGKVKSLYSE